MSELWAAARQQIAEYEQRNAAFALSLQTEKDALAAVGAATEKINAEKAAVVQRMLQLEQRKEQASVELARLNEQVAREEQTSALLTRQLALYSDSREEAVRRMEADRQRCHEHLSMLRRQLQAAEDYLGSGHTAESCAVLA